MPSRCFVRRATGPPPRRAATTRASPEPPEGGDGGAGACWSAGCRCYAQGPGALPKFAVPGSDQSAVGSARALGSPGDSETGWCNGDWCSVFTVGAYAAPDQISRVRETSLKRFIQVADREMLMTRLANQSTKSAGSLSRRGLILRAALISSAALPGVRSSRGPGRIIARLG